MVVAIDGPAGTGKSTISHAVAKAMGFAYLNSGKFYRAITYRALRQNIDLEDQNELTTSALGISINVSAEDFLVDGANVDDELHGSAVDLHVAAVSAIPRIRALVNDRLLGLAKNQDIVAEGRDMSTVVFPDAEVKIFLDADVHERARRRHRQQPDEPFDAILAAISGRDQIDRTKAVGKLELSADATRIDTTDLTIEQVCDMVIGIIHKKKEHGRSI